jgi:purine-nucleoside phosphorylase, family 1 (deoD)
MCPIPTPHITAEKNDFAKTVLMPGDPLRAKLIAEEFFKKAKLVNNVRGVQGYTGEYKGKRVSVMASGMGMPSMGIYSYELFNFYGVENIIRVGSAGSLNEDVNLRDIIIAMSAHTDSNYSKSFGFSGMAAPSCDYGLLKRAQVVAEEKQLPVKIGAVYTSDAFYNQSGTLPVMQRYGALGVEMETAALYLNAALAKKKALAILTVSDNALTLEGLSAKERQMSFTQMIELALETVPNLE